MLFSLTSKDVDTPSEISGDCSLIDSIIPHDFESNPNSGSLKPISDITLLTTDGISTYALVVISPIITTKPVVIETSHATLAFGSNSIILSSTESEI